MATTGVAAEVKRRLTARGVSFGAAPDGVFALDPVPRVLTAPEWSELQAGVVQRLRALEALVGDVYGDGRVFEAGVLSREEVEASPHYEPTMRGATPPRWVSFAGLDVVRTPDGRFRVIEDQVRMPAGIAYSVAALAWLVATWRRPEEGLFASVGGILAPLGAIRSAWASAGFRQR